MPRAAARRHSCELHGPHVEPDCPQCAAAKRPALEVPCPTCYGSGRVKGERAEWVKLGAEMRADRVARDKTILEESRERDIPQCILGDMEAGRVRPIVRDELAL